MVGTFLSLYVPWSAFAALSLPDVTTEIYTLPIMATCSVLWLYLPVHFTEI